VVSFICGFSERFAIGLVGNVEKRLDVSPAQRDAVKEDAKGGE